MLLPVEDAWGSFTYRESFGDICIATAIWFYSRKDNLIPDTANIGTTFNIVCNDNNMKGELVLTTSDKVRKPGFVRIIPQAGQTFH
jgi:hypothetical protein